VLTGPHVGERGKGRAWAGELERGGESLVGPLGPKQMEREFLFFLFLFFSFLLFSFVSFYLKSHLKLIKNPFEILLNFTQGHTVQKYKCSSMSAHTCF